MTNPDSLSKKNLVFDKINYYKYPVSQNDKPFKFKISYNYENQKPYRWLELDSAGKVMTDYIYEYDENWVQTGAKYREDGTTDFSVEKVSFRNDSTMITKWLDSIGNVYYTMVDNLNKFNKTYRAEFIGDKSHGFDSTFYTREGFQKRIFFTSVSGKVYNDRSFEYDSTNSNNDWVIRRKIMDDTIREIQKREIHYENDYIADNGRFYEGFISTREWSENVFSFTRDESLLFFTRTSDWVNQTPYISKLKNGIYTEPEQITELGTIYNGAISPSRDKIIFCTRSDNELTIFLANKKNNHWTDVIDLTATSGLHGGYFHWLNDLELCFQSEENNGDLVIVELKENKLKLTDKLDVLNTETGTEFSPYISSDKKYIIFTRYLEGDKNNQGFFVSYNQGNSNSVEWSKPTRLEMLPYGWSARMINNNAKFMYTDGDNIYTLKSEKLNLKTK
ncbi:hypothetical protein LBV24_09580 [Winogradskyella sp. 2Y89]|uniref:WD40-like Beta Propeller Repeat n=2 Tax=Winogradskyella vincentii TaxID=2877122 RepID=A0ABS7Y2I6_9FLAO|nr:hypothetical protein [Winogradskyella vincentii]